MSARDLFHDIVKKALQQDGWTITHDPYALSADNIDQEAISQWIPQLSTVTISKNS